MACDTVASFSVLEEASSVGDGYLLVDAPKSFSGRTAKAKPFSPSLVDPDVNVIQEDLDAQLNELQSIVSRMGIGSSTAGPQPGARATLAPPVATRTDNLLRQRPLSRHLSRHPRTLSRPWKTNLIPDKSSWAPGPSWSRAGRPWCLDAATSGVGSTVCPGGELKALLSEFGTASWQAPLVARIVDVHVIAKRSAEYNQLPTA